MSEYSAVFDSAYAGTIIQRRESEEDATVFFVSGPYLNPMDAKQKAQELTEIDRIMNKRG